MCFCLAKVAIMYTHNLIILYLKICIVFKIWRTREGNGVQFCHPGFCTIWKSIPYKSVTLFIAALFHFLLLLLGGMVRELVFDTSKSQEWLNSMNFKCYPFRDKISDNQPVSMTIMCSFTVTSLTSTHMFLPRDNHKVLPGC